MTTLMTLIVGAVFTVLNVAEVTHSVAEVTHSVAEMPPIHTVDSFEQLPASVRQLPDAMYIQWIKMHNQLAREEARSRADVFNSRRSSVITTVTDSYDGYANRRQYNEGAQTVLRDYSTPRWGGGPVLILNPYYRKSNIQEN